MTICFNSNKAVHWSLQFVFKKDPTIFEVGAVTSCTCFGTRNHWKNQLRTWRNDLKLLLLTCYDIRHYPYVILTNNVLAIGSVVPFKSGVALIHIGS